MGQSATYTRSAFGLSSAVEMAETFLWTSLANEACVVEADRQTD